MEEEDEEETFEDLVPSRKRKHGASEAGSVASRKTAASKTSTKSEPSMKYRAGGSGIHRDMDKANQTPGAEYRSKKARGDVKRKGKPDPYAYVPLSHGGLTKRKGAKAGSQRRSKDQVKDV